MKLLVVAISIGIASGACKGKENAQTTSAPVAEKQQASTAVAAKPVMQASSGKPMPDGYASVATTSDGKTMQLPFTQIGVARCANMPCLMLTAERPDGNASDSVLDGATIDAHLVLTDKGKTKLADLVGASFTTVEDGLANGKPARLDSLHVFGREAGRLIDGWGRDAKVSIAAVTDTAIDGQVEADVCDGPMPDVSAPCAGKWHVTLKFHALRNPSATDEMFAQVAE